MIHTVHEAETGGQDFTLYDQNGAYNGTGATVTLLLKDRNQGIVDMTAKVNWLLAASGTVRVLPSLGDLLADRSPYSATFKVTISGLDSYFPNKPGDEWHVWK